MNSCHRAVFIGPQLGVHSQICMHVWMFYELFIINIITAWTVDVHAINVFSVRLRAARAAKSSGASSLEPLD